MHFDDHRNFFAEMALFMYEQRFLARCPELFDPLPCLFYYDVIDNKFMHTERFLYGNFNENILQSSYKLLDVVQEHLNYIYRHFGCHLTPISPHFGGYTVSLT